MKKIEKEIKELNKSIVENLTKGIIKTSLSVLPLLLSVSTFGTGIWAEVEYAQCQKGYKAFRNDESYLAAQAEDIATLDNQQKKGEINALQYKDALDYIQSEEHFQNFMAQDEQFQNLLKNRDFFNKLGAGCLAAGILFPIFYLFLFWKFIGFYELADVKDLIKEKKRLMPLKKKEMLDGDKPEEELPDLGDEFYKNDEEL